MTLLLMNAAQSAKWKCVSPFAVLEELEELVRAVSVYEFLRQEPMPGGFHDNGQFITQVHDRLIERIDDEVRTSMGWSMSDVISNSSNATSPRCRVG